MGQKKGCIQKGNVGRPKGRKDSYQRQVIPVQGTEDIRMTLAQAVREKQPELIKRLFVELQSLEGYAYVSALNVIYKQILPALQSIELNANVEKRESLLLEHIESLKLTSA